METEEILNKSDLVWDYFSKHPHEEITPKDLAQKLDSNYDTVNSAIYRLYLSRKIIKRKRGTYILSKLPKGQTTFENNI
jgi:glutathionyl-hydroquinone reductase